MTSSPTSRPEPTVAKKPHVLSLKNTIQDEFFGDVDDATLVRESTCVDEPTPKRLKSAVSSKLPLINNTKKQKKVQKARLG